MENSKIAVLICSNVIGGHEYQSVELVRDLMEYADVTVYVNRDEHKPIYLEFCTKVISLPQQLLKPGKLPVYVWNGFRNRHKLRKVIYGYDQILVCAGTVEAGISTSIALHGTVPISLYLPSFFDRVLIWGKIGHLYNALLASFCRLYEQIITINRIQAKVIKGFTGVKTVVVSNKIRDVPIAPSERPGKLLFVGRLDGQKRVKEILNWIDFHDNPFKEILIVGDGPDRSAIEEVAANLKYVKVIFMGWLNASEQDHLIDRNDVLLLNSLLEGEPLVVRESILRGIRVVARDIIGVRGITHRNQRFSSIFEFQNILRSLPVFQRDLVHRRSNSSERLARSRQVEFVIARLVG